MTTASRAPTLPTDSTPPDPSTDARVAASADNWRRKLLDLTKRNRALNFRPARVSTVAVVDEQARLTIEEQGVNTLFLALGMLHYKDAADSDVVLRAPLVLLPVELTRKSARTGFTMRATDDEPLVNPALVEYLRRSVGIGLPELPTTDATGDDYDLQPFFASSMLPRTWVERRRARSRYCRA